MKLARASILLLALGTYLAVPFQLTESVFWTSGLGDWMDPYFINYLLEHWYRSALDLHNPASPPMFYPARGTLGYSHGLVLYAPFYVAARLFLHPFQAYNVTIFLVIVSGTLCLFVLLRRFFRLSLFESFLISAAFVASPNVTDGSLGAWSQRASVFVIPPIILMCLFSRETTSSRSTVALAFLSGLLGTLLFTQDFHTALFAFFLLALAVVPLLFTAMPRSYGSIGRFWQHETPRSRVALLIGAAAALWTLWLLVVGGGGIELFGVTMTTRDWRRPALIAVAAALAWIPSTKSATRHAVATWAIPWRLAFGAGGLLGAIAFLAVYLQPYRDHRAFPETELLNAMFVREPSQWHSLSAFLSGIRGYESLSPFAVILIITVLAFAARNRIDRVARWLLVWGLLISIVVLLMPLQLGGFAIWRAVFEHLPGFSAIRDPKRIIYMYELGVALTTGWFLSILPRRSLLRITTAVVLLVIIAMNRHVPSFVILRPNTTYARWVEAGIDIDPACRSFYIQPASSEYASRPNSAWTVYHMDAMFIALNHALPTLNGYSAWAPPGWGIGNPHDAGYLDAVKRWIELNHLEGVCALDIEQRTMRIRE